MQGRYYRDERPDNHDMLIFVRMYPGPEPSLLLLTPKGRRIENTFCGHVGKPWVPRLVRIFDKKRLYFCWLFSRFYSIAEQIYVIADVCGQGWTLPLWGHVRDKYVLFYTFPRDMKPDTAALNHEPSRPIFVQQPFYTSHKQNINQARNNVA